MSALTQPGSTYEPEVPGLRTLYDLLAALTRSESIEDVYDACVTSLLRSTGADRAAILRFDNEGVMQFEAWRGLSPEYRRAVTGHTPWQAGDPGAHPVLVSDVRKEPSLELYVNLLEREHIAAMAFIPLALDAGVFGKFMLYYREPHEFSEEEIAIAQAIAGHVALASERKRAEFALRRSEQRLQAILDNSPAIIFMKNAEGRYELVNRRHEEMCGFPPGSVVGKTDRELHPPDIASRYEQNYQAVLANRAPLTTEETVRSADGVHSYLSVKFPVYGPDREIAGVCGIATDITERKRFEEASQRLAAIVASSEDAILSHDINGFVTSWNQGAERLYGYSAEEAIGRPMLMLADPKQPQELLDLRDRIWAGQHVQRYETVRRRKDGRLIHVSLSASPIRNAAGQIVGAAKIAHDITDRQRADEEKTEILQREQIARRRAELMNLIGPTLVTELDLQKVVQGVTDVATSLAGAEFGAFFHNVVNAKGESYMLYSLSGAPKEAFSKFGMPRNTAVFEPTFKGTAIVRSDDITKDPRYGRNLPNRGLPDGHLPVRSYLAIPVISRTGEVLGGLFFGHSATARFTEDHELVLKGLAAQAAIAIDNARLFERAQWAQAELKRSNEELQQANHDLETFAYSASHDLQEPLRTIGISAQLLEQACGQQLSRDGQEFLAAILRGTRNMSELLQDLLAYTLATKKSEGPAPALPMEPVMARLVETLRDRIDRAGGSVEWGPLPTVYAHESRITVVLQNLIGNALKYRRQDAPHIRISAVEQDGWAVFSVKDNGIGIDAKYADQVFGLFKRLHSRDRYPGSGIGLAICQRIVEQYGGRIWLEESTLGEGSTFCFSIPTRIGESSTEGK